MIHPISAYCKYFLASKNHHGVHSPFLFEYITKGLQHSPKVDLGKVDAFRKQLLSNHNTIEIKDFGAGSKRLNNKKRQVSDIASKAGITKKRGELLTNTVRYFKPNHILEIGSSLGLSTVYMATGAPEAKITALEGCPETAKIAQQNFDNFEFENINLIVGRFEDTLNKALQNNSYDLIFFDGNHQEQPTINYFEQCLESAHEHSVFIFDDIHWSPGMEKAWDYIQNHEKVTLSVDTFKWGLVFFRKGKVKEHISLRI